MANSVTLEHFDLVSEFEAAEAATRDARLLSEQCRDYHDDKQWTEAERTVIEARGEPVVTQNEIRPKVNTMLGLEKQTRKDPKAYPRNPGDDKAAYAATDALRYVCDDNNWAELRSQATGNIVVEGTGAIMVGVKETKDGIDPSLTRIPWSRLAWDPASEEYDFKDARFMEQVIWMDLDDAIRAFPDAEDALTATMERGRGEASYDDKPKNMGWADFKRRRVRLVERYGKDDGVWTFCIFTRAGFVVEPQVSPYLDADGEPECPIKAVSLYVGRDNERYGEVQSWISPQDESNKRRSKLLHLTNSRQMQAMDADVAMASDPDLVRKEAAKADGVLPAGWQPVPTSDLAQGNLLLMQDSRDYIHRSGANQALAGKETQGQSGKAISLQQQGGMIESATYLDAVRTLSLQVYRSIWGRVRQHWKEERWVRVTEDKRNMKFVGFNRPVTALEAAAERLGVDPEKPQNADPQALQMLQAFAADPRAQQVVRMDAVPADMDVDIILDEGVDSPTLQAEQFEQLVGMLPALGPMAQHPKVMELVIEASSFRDKDKLLEIIQGEGQADPAAAMAQQQQALQQQAQFEAQVEIDKAKVKAESDMQIAQLKAQVEYQIKQQELELDAEIAERKLRAEVVAQERKLEVESKLRLIESDATGEAERNRSEADAVKSNAEVMQQMVAVLAEMAKPKNKIPVRDESGLIVGIREVAAS